VEKERKSNINYTSTNVSFYNVFFYPLFFSQLFFSYAPPYEFFSSSALLSS